MKKKLSKHGNSKAIIIDKPILELLGINDKTELELTTDGKSITIKPIRKKTKKTPNKKQFEKLLEKNLKKYAPLLKKLAKT